MKLSQDLEITEEDVEVAKILFRYARQFIELTDPTFLDAQEHHLNLTEERILNHLNKQVRN